MSKLLSSRWTKVFLFALCLVPLLLLLWHLLLLWKNGYDSALTANPIEYVTHKTGDWIIRFLLITLCVTPLRKLSNQPKVTRYRRMLGLFAFFYGFLHLMTWMWLDKFFDLPEMLKDVVKRPFITAGMTGFALMIPLAITSTAGWVRRLGFARWQLLHRLVYFSALAGVIHYYWLVKSDVREPLMYGAMLAVLMSYRLVIWLRPPAKRPAPAVSQKQRAEAPATPKTASLRD
jgi:sulfoxide reductase heme-binding subunit YedZ